MPTPSSQLTAAPSRNIASTTIAGRCGITHQAVLKLIDSHLASIEEDFGPVRFEAPDGKPHQRIAHLTEQQAFFLALLLPNTDGAVEFKGGAVRKFHEMRDHRESVTGILVQEHQQKLLASRNA
jgi:phage regulator Rha-like protein